MALKNMWKKIIGKNNIILYITIEFMEKCVKKYFNKLLGSD